MKEAGYAEILRLIKEEEPPRPSTRLSDSGEALASISAQRHMEPAKLTKLVRGELDWIVMKTLEKDRNRRYETAKDFAADVQRYLGDEPVQACPPSALYRFRKFARRNKAVIGVAGMVLFFLVLLGSGAGWVARDRESRKERTVTEAKAAWADVERLRREGNWPAALSVARRAETLLTGAEADPELSWKFSELCRDLEMAARLEEIRVREPEVRAGRYSWKQAGPEYEQAFRDYGIDVETLAPAEAARRIRERTIPEELAAALDDWASSRGRKDEAGAKRLRAVARGADPDPWRNRLRDAIESGQGTLLMKLSASDEIDRLPPTTAFLLASALVSTGAKGTAVEVVRKAQQLHPDDFFINLVLAEALIQEPATRGEGIGFYRAALACRPQSFAVHLVLGHTLQEQGKARQAADVFRRATQLRPDSAWAHFLLGGALQHLDRLPEALDEYRRAVQLNLKFEPSAAPAPEWLREAERLVKLDDKLPAVLRGEVRPRDAAELTEFAFVCRFRELEAASARLYREAFVQQPELAKQHRYYAAWAAVLAGIGKGKDAGGLEERERTRLRGQARVWLRDELDAWRQRLGKDTAESRAEVLQRINCWLRDPDLVCVRDPELLQRLPAAERGEWEQLWRDLRELLASVQSTK
jgi:tetratricopeptide (TPR) repeat protein